MTNIMSITSIIPSIIFGIILILAWLPIIILTEKNNKGNNDEYKLLENKIKTDLKLTDVTTTYPYILINDVNIDNYLIKSTILSNNNNNLLIISYKNTKTIDNNGKQIINTYLNNEYMINIPLVNGNEMDKEDYKYLALQNKLFNTTTIDSINNNITYDLTFYNIPANKSIMKVDGLQQYENELDMKIYNYEFGTKDNAISAIKNRKLRSDTLQMWAGRIGTFLMLFIGLSLLISPLTYLNQIGDTFVGPLKLLAIPGKLIVSLYETLSFFGSLILTLLMTFFIWSIINHPTISIVIGGLIIGLILYYK